MDYNFRQNNTIIIIGRSTFLDDPTVQENVNYIQYKYHCIGINQAAIKYRTEYYAFTDPELQELYKYLHPKTKIISSLINFTSMFQGDFYQTDSLPLDKPPFNNDTYAFYGFTHDMCISWAYMKRYENVILLGVADFTEDNQHAKALISTPLHSNSFIYSNICKRSSVNFINNVFPYIKVYTLNPKSLLSVEKITFKDLFSP